MGGLTLHPMKEIRVIVAGEHRAFVTELLDRVNAGGYTIIGNLSGRSTVIRTALRSHVCGRRDGQPAGMLRQEG